MQPMFRALFVSLLVLGGSAQVLAQGAGRGPLAGAPDKPDVPGARPGAGGGMHPLMAVLDADRNGELSADEIRKAVRSLKKLDRNRDGKLSADELAPAAGFDLPGAAGAKGAPRRGGAVPRGRGPVAPGVGAAGMPPGGFGNLPVGGLPAGSNVRGRGGLSRPPGAGVPSQLSQLMRFDRNRDGRVTREEVPPQLRPLLERFDRNRDGALDLQELRMLSGQAGRLRGGR